MTDENIILFLGYYSFKYKFLKIKINICNIVVHYILNIK
jgi:hypothetical protein